MTTQQNQGGIVTHVGLALQLILPAALTMVGKLQNELSYPVFIRGWTVSPGFPETMGTAHWCILCSSPFSYSFPFFISYNNPVSVYLTYATIILLCSKAHWNFSFLASLYNQQVFIVHKQTNLQYCAGVQRAMFFPIKCGSSSFPCYQQ